jgi:hypothetical protein
MGTVPPYLLASALFRMTRRPLLLGGLGVLCGYLRGMLGGKARYEDPEFRRFLRSYQWMCLLGGKGWATRKVNRQQEACWKPSPATAAAITP